MKILTVSASPFLLTKLGRINSDILCYFRVRDYKVATLAWDLDTMWFVPDQDGRIHYEKNGEKVCEIYPLPNSPEESAVQAYEVVKALEPDVVISVGEARETDFVASLKSICPNQFKWINICTAGSLPIASQRVEALSQADLSLVTTKAGVADFESKLIPSYYLPYGPSIKLFYPKNLDKNKFSVINLSKNSTASNTAAFIKAMVLASRLTNGEVSGYLHSNVNDIGDYDVLSLIDQYGAKDIIRLPEAFVGLNDGIAASDLNDEMNNASVVVDVSVRSATALGVLEAMSTGCFPLVTPAGALKEVVQNIPSSYRCFVDSVEYIGFDGESCQIASIDSLAEKIKNIYYQWKDHRAFFDRCSEEAKKAAEIYSNRKFLQNLEGFLKSSMNKANVLTVETF